MPHHVTILLLAAGESSRYGSPKQLIPYGGTSLIRHLAKVALESKASSVTVVLGADIERIKIELAGLSVHIVHNAECKEGIGSSIRTGINNLPDEVDAVLIMLCDQPLVTVEHLNSIIDKRTTTDKPVVASEYSDTRGVPALFARSLFPELISLKDDKGAKVVIERHANDVTTISFPNGAIDIDKPEDLP